MARRNICGRDSRAFSSRLLYKQLQQFKSWQRCLHKYLHAYEYNCEFVGSLLGIPIFCEYVVAASDRSLFTCRWSLDRLLSIRCIPNLRKISIQIVAQCREARQCIYSSCNPADGILQGNEVQKWNTVMWRNVFVTFQCTLRNFCMILGDSSSKGRNKHIPLVLLQILRDSGQF